VRSILFHICDILCCVIHAERRISAADSSARQTPPLLWFSPLLPHCFALRTSVLRSHSFFSHGCDNTGAPHGSPTDADSQWQYANIVDKGMMGRAAMKVLDGSDLKIGVASLNLLSSGIQMHLKNVLDGAFRLSRSRMNQTAIGSYTSELTMCLCLRCSGSLFRLCSVV
jgi:hypothetical protein